MVHIPRYWIQKRFDKLKLSSRSLKVIGE